MLRKAKVGFAGSIFLSLLVSPFLLDAAKMRADCFQYAYSTALSILNHKKRAFDIAADSCRMEVGSSCLKYAYERLGASPQLSTWGEAVNICRKRVDDKCLLFAENFWQQTEKPRDKDRAFQMAAQSCHDEVYGDCLQYVYEHEKMIGRDNVTAFGAGVTVCRGGLLKPCLQTVYENISPDARPDAWDHWGDAVSVCSRK